MQPNISSLLYEGQKVKVPTSTIYGLYDPLSPNLYRYIGISDKGLPEILHTEIEAARSNPAKYVSLWINALIHSGRRPKIRQIKVVHRKIGAIELKNTINKYNTGNNLTNYNIGKKISPDFIKNIENDEMIKQYLRSINNDKNNFVFRVPPK